MVGSISSLEDHPARFWARVDDSDAWVLATEMRGKSSSKDWRPFPRTRRVFQRAHFPKGCSPLLNEADATLLVPVDEDPDPTTADLVQIHSTDPGAILHQLRIRLELDEPFTSIGPLLIAINPRRLVRRCSSDGLSDLQQLMSAEHLPPHPFTIAHSAYSVMLRTSTPQCVCVLGESGAGKTEIAKLCLISLAEISRSSGSQTECALGASQLLEGFGNAATAINSNASRFGSWLVVEFELDGTIGRCSVHTFLLERSRALGSTALGERSFHVFYQLLAGIKQSRGSGDSGMSRLDKLRMSGSGADGSEDGLLAGLGLLCDPAAYTCTRTSDHASDPTDHASGWLMTVNLLRTLGFDAGQQRQVVLMLSAILLLTNVSFMAGSSSGGSRAGGGGCNGGEGAHPSSLEVLCLADNSIVERAAALLRIPHGPLQQALLSRRLPARARWSGTDTDAPVPHSLPQALRARDVLIKVPLVSSKWVARSE